MQDAVTAITADHGSGQSHAGARLRLIWRNIFPFVVVGAIWEIIAWSGIFPRRLFPTLEEITASFVNLTITGILPHHAIETVIRLLTGFALASIVGVTIGVLMGRSRRAEDIFLPLVSMAPDPAYAPLFCSGSDSAISRPSCWSALFRLCIIFNSWTGVKAVKIWVAKKPGAPMTDACSATSFSPALPYILTGLRLRLAQLGASAWQLRFAAVREGWAG